MDELARLRERIDATDAEIIRHVAARLEIIREVAEYKKRTGMASYQPNRANAVRDRYVQDGAAAGMPAAFALGLIDLLLAEAHRLEDEIIDAETAGR